MSRHTQFIVQAVEHCIVNAVTHARSRVDGLFTCTIAPVATVDVIIVGSWLAIRAIVLVNLVDASSTSTCNIGTICTPQVPFAELRRREAQFPGVAIDTRIAARNHPRIKRNHEHQHTVDTATSDQKREGANGDFCDEGRRARLLGEIDTRRGIAAQDGEDAGAEQRSPRVGHGLAAVLQRHLEDVVGPVVARRVGEVLQLADVHVE